jgi:ubiquinone/menaquinone biosynthesis C-methylase UbiE
MLDVKKMGMYEKQIREVVKKWFTETADREWRRLRQDPYHKIEFITTMHFLNRRLPRRGLILDAGGGPGRYTIELAKRGCDVILLDLAPEMLKIAGREIKKAKVQTHVKKLLEGSIDDLSMFGDETFDAVLCSGGALNHLLDAKQRVRASSELGRIAKKEALIFVSVISRIGLLRTILVNFPHEMKYAKNHLETGDYVPGLHGEGFTAAH